MVSTRSQSQAAQNNNTLPLPQTSRAQSVQRSASRSKTLNIDKAAVKQRLNARPAEQPIDDDYDEDEPLSARSNQSGYQSGYHSDFQPEPSSPFTPNDDNDPHHSLPTSTTFSTSIQPSDSPIDQSDSLSISPQPTPRSRTRFVLSICCWLFVIIPIGAIALAVLLASHIQPLSLFVSDSLSQSIPELPFLKSLVSFLPRRSTSDIDFNIYRNVSSIVHTIEQHHPQFEHWAEHTLYNALRSHFSSDELSRPARPLVFFIAIQCESAQCDSCKYPHRFVDPLAVELSELLYPHSMPSYLLDLSDRSQQPHFNASQLVELIDQHASLHSGHGLVYLPDLQCAPNRRPIGEKLQRYLDFENAPHLRLVYLITVTITKGQYDRAFTRLRNSVKGSGADISEAEIIREFNKVALASGDSDVSRARDAELMDSMLARIEQRGTIVNL